MSWAPHVTVAAIAEQQGRFLLVEEQIKGEVLFNQPAGHLERGENLIEAVVRETLEETGGRFRPMHLIGLYRWVKPQDGTTFLRACFSGPWGEQDPDRPLDQAVLRTHWLTREEVAERTTQLRSPLVLRCIDDYLAGRRYPLELLIDLA